MIHGAFAVGECLCHTSDGRRVYRGLTSNSTGKYYAKPRTLKDFTIDNLHADIKRGLIVPRPRGLMNTIQKIAKTLRDADLPAHEVVVALCIAMEHVDEPKTIEKYGIVACDALRELRTCGE